MSEMHLCSPNSFRTLPFGVDPVCQVPRRLTMGAGVLPQETTAHAQPFEYKCSTKRLSRFFFQLLFFFFSTLHKIAKYCLPNTTIAGRYRYCNCAQDRNSTGRGKLHTNFPRILVRAWVKCDYTYSLVYIAVGALGLCV